MPIRETKHDGKESFKWGTHGASYPDRKQAQEQAEAAYAHGYKGDDPCIHATHWRVYSPRRRLSA